MTTMAIIERKRNFDVGGGAETSFSLSVASLYSIRGNSFSSHPANSPMAIVCLKVGCSKVPTQPFFIGISGIRVVEYTRKFGLVWLPCKMYSFQVINHFISLFPI